MKNVAFIPVRGGSKGLPRKNILNICNKPLVAWTIEQALQSELIDEVYVSTDCKKIAEISKTYGAKVPFLRPQSISGDAATTESAMIHFCEWLIEQEISVDNIILLQATSPIRAKGRLDQALNYFEINGYDSLLSVSESHRFFWRKKNGISTSEYDYKNRPRRQDIENTDRRFMETGSFYISKFEGLMLNKNRLFGNIGMFETPENESYEIDTALDFKVCETLMSNLIKEYN